ncbi:MAG: acyltransferase, partial [Actinobacteria bacterium]|nr:acyltransferase [Actinomycetota bacterium]
GVDLFFALSGFLITSLLLTEVSNSGQITLLAFWGRRARRLLPALSLVVTFVALLSAFAYAPGSFHHLRADAAASLLYVANWQFIGQGVDYFSAQALASPLTHTWSLAIEEQFYLLWPIVVLLIMRWRKSRLLLAGLAIALALASALEMYLGSLANWSQTRLYYGTDSHAMGLALGAGLAALLTECSLERQSQKCLFAVLGFAGLAAWLSMALGVGGDPQWMYRGGFFLVSLFATALIASVWKLPNSALARVLAIRPLRALGKISYGIYLWHYPIFLWLSSARTGFGGWGLFLLRLVVTLVISSFSYLAIERHVRSDASFARWPGVLAIGVSIVIAYGAVLLATA